MRDDQIYSPEASDGTPDWPSKIGMAAWVIVALGLIALLIGRCT